MLLAHLTYTAAGVDGKPTVRLAGVNVQVVAGAQEDERTGLGNLIVGNDENVRLQTGSNNLVVGGEQEFTSFGASLGGFDNKALGEYSDAWGYDNTASGDRASVSGGSGNTASGASASVSGGGLNNAANTGSSVSGGEKNDAEAEWAAVLGGFENTAKGKFSSVVGGKKQEPKNEYESL